MEIELKLNPFVKTSQRESTQILDLLGDIGGFYATVDLFLFMIGGYFSNRFYMAAVAKDFYLKKTDASLKKNPSTAKLKSLQNKLYKEDPKNPLNILNSLDKTYPNK